MVVLLQNCYSFLDGFQVLSGLISDRIAYSLWGEFHLLLNLDSVLDVAEELGRLLEDLVVQEADQVVVVDQVQIQEELLEQPTEQKV